MHARLAGLIVASSLAVCACSPSTQLTPATADEAAALAAAFDVQLHNKQAATELFRFDSQVDVAVKGIKVTGPRQWLHRLAAAHGARQGLRNAAVSSAVSLNRCT